MIVYFIMCSLFTGNQARNVLKLLQVFTAFFCNFHYMYAPCVLYSVVGCLSLSVRQSRAVRSYSSYGYYVYFMWPIADKMR